VFNEDEFDQRVLFSVGHAADWLLCSAEAIDIEGRSIG
jgi:hypothetical protein